MNTRPLFPIACLLLLLDCRSARAPLAPSEVPAAHRAPPALPKLDWVPLFSLPERALAWSDDRSLAILSRGLELSLWDTASGAARASLGLGDAAAFTPSGQTLAIESNSELRVLERSSLRVLNVFKVPVGQRLVALLESPLRVVTQADERVVTDPSGDQSLPNEVRIRSANGALLSKVGNCGRLLAFSPDRQIAIDNGGLVPGGGLLRVVSFPSCTALAAYSDGAGYSTLSRAAFSSDGKHAFMTLAQSDVNDQPMTRRLLRWDGAASVREVAKFEPSSDREIDFDELLVDATASHVAFANVRYFTPRQCVNCTYADADSIGGIKGKDDFLVFDAQTGKALDSESFLQSNREGTAFLPRITSDDLEKFFEMTRLHAEFSTPAGSPQRLLVADESGPRPAPHNQLQVGVDWFSFMTPDRRLVFVDLANGRALTSGPATNRLNSWQVYAISPDKRFVASESGEDIELRRIDAPDVPRVRVVKGASLVYGLSPWSTDSRHFLVQRDVNHCRWRMPCIQQRFVVGVAESDSELPSMQCTEPTISGRNSCQSEAGSVFAAEPAHVLPNFEQLTIAARAAVGSAQHLRGVFQAAGVLLLAGGQYDAEASEFALVRQSDGARLGLRVAEEQPVFIAEDSSFGCTSPPMPRLSFVHHGQAGSGPLLTAAQVAKACFVPDLLSRFIRGEKTRCVAP